jgi:hypothetical protein
LYCVVDLRKMKIHDVLIMSNIIILFIMDEFIPHLEIDNYLSCLSSYKTHSLDSFITCKGEEITDFCLEYLLKYTRLKYLILKWCERITDDGLLKLSRNKTLSHLRVYCMDNISDTGIKNISLSKTITHLEFVNFTISLVGEMGRSYLSNLKTLTHLTIDSMSVIKYLSSTKSLTYLEIRGYDSWVVNESIIGHVSKIKTLKYLWFNFPDTNYELRIELHKHLYDSKIKALKTIKFDCFKSDVVVNNTEKHRRFNRYIKRKFFS